MEFENLEKKFSNSKDPRVRRSFLLIAGPGLELEKKRLKLKLQEFEAEHKKIMERIKRGQNSHQEKHKSTVNKAKLRSVQNVHDELRNDLQAYSLDEARSRGDLQTSKSLSEIKQAVQKHPSQLPQITCAQNVISAPDKDTESHSSGETTSTDSGILDQADNNKKAGLEPTKPLLRRSKTLSAITARGIITASGFVSEEMYRLKLAHTSCSVFRPGIVDSDNQKRKRCEMWTTDTQNNENTFKNAIKNRPVGLLSPTTVQLAPFRPAYHKGPVPRRTLRRTVSHPLYRERGCVMMTQAEPTLAELMKECAKSRYLRTPGSNSD